MIMNNEKRKREKKKTSMCLTRIWNLKNKAGHENTSETTNNNKKKVFCAESSQSKLLLTRLLICFWDLFEFFETKSIGKHEANSKILNFLLLTELLTL